MNNNFKNWFGDSKVVDENGEPLVVYHGSKNDFNIFDLKTVKYVGSNGDGFYFSPDKHESQQYGDNVREFFIKIENPISPNNRSLTVKDYKSVIDKIWSDKEYKDDLKNYGYFEDSEYVSFRNKLANDLIEKDDYSALFDLTNTVTGSIRFLAKLLEESSGIVYDGVISPVFREYVAFYPNQIKLADGSNTTFDENNPDIRFNKGGEVDNTEKNKDMKNDGNVYGLELEETSNGIPFDEFIASRDGASFILYPNSNHKKSDIEKAKEELKSQRDVIAIRVANDSDLDDLYKKAIFRDARTKPLKWYQIEQDEKLLREERKKGTTPEEFVTKIVLLRVKKTETANLKQYGKSIYKMKDGGQTMGGREVLYENDKIKLEHNTVSDTYSVVDAETGAFMEKGGKLSGWFKGELSFLNY
jgi:hypothetical protein